MGTEIPDGRRFKSDRAHFYAYPDSMYSFSIRGVLRLMANGRSFHASSS